MDWIALLDGHGIPYVTRGPNTKRGEVSVQCPYCGDEDPSQHMGISLSSENWGCYRNSEHRGKKPQRLVAGLLGCNYARARLVMAQYSHTDPDGLDAALALLTQPVTPAVATRLEWPTEFKPIVNEGTRARYWEYLRRRGFDPVGDLVFRYKLYCCNTGPYKDRVIFPLYQGGELVGWTARCLADKPLEAPRYLSSHGDAIKRTILFEDDLQRGGNVLAVCEGPFDALKVDRYGLGTVRATCTFGTHVSDEQMAILHYTAKKYKEVVTMFDTDARAQSLDLHTRFKDSGHRVRHITYYDWKDPGSIPGRTISNWAKCFA